MRWVLLRGWGRETRHWGEFPRLLAAAFPGADVQALDLPGNGARNAERTPTTISGITDAVRAPGARVHLLGLSLGGMVCVDWATRFPQEIAACVLLNTSLRPFAAIHERLRPASYGAIARLVLEGDAGRREAGILALTSGGGSAALAQAWAGYAAERPVSRANVLRQLVAAARFRAAAPPPVPTLVLAGARDRLVDPGCSRKLASAWKRPLAMHPEAGHDLALDAGPWVVGEMRAWLGGFA